MRGRSTGAALALATALLAAGCAGPELPVLGKVENLRLETSRGGVLETSDLDGKVHVVDFIFTSCQMACPKMTTAMKRIYDEFEAAEDLRFLSVSTDPGTDTVEVLHDYARRFGVDEERWIFGRVEGEELVRLSEKEFLLGASGFPVGHSLKFVLVDDERRIRGYYDSESEEELTELRQELRRMLG